MHSSCFLKENEVFACRYAKEDDEIKKTKDYRKSRAELFAENRYSNMHICVCIQARMHVYKSIYSHANTYARAYVCTFCKRMCIYVFEDYLRSRAKLFAENRFLCMHVFLCVYFHTYMLISTHAFRYLTKVVHKHRTRNHTFVYY